MSRERYPLTFREYARTAQSFYPQYEIGWLAWEHALIIMTEEGAFIDEFVGEGVWRANFAYARLLRKQWIDGLSRRQKRKIEEQAFFMRLARSFLEAPQLIRSL